MTPCEKSASWRSATPSAAAAIIVGRWPILSEPWPLFSMFAKAAKARSSHRGSDDLDGALEKPFAVGQKIHLDSGNDEWGRACSDGNVLDFMENELLVCVESIRANIFVPKTDAFLADTV